VSKKKNTAHSQAEAVPRFRIGLPVCSLSSLFQWAKLTRLRKLKFPASFSDKRCR